MAKTFLQFLNEKEQKQANLPAVSQALNDFASDVTKFAGPPAECKIVLGGITNDGQEYRGVLSFPPLDYAQTLFRAYISLKDQSIAFHPAGGKLERNVDNLHDRLMALLQLPALMETLQYIKEKSRQFRKEGRVA